MDILSLTGLEKLSETVTTITLGADGSRQVNGRLTIALLLELMDAIPPQHAEPLLWESQTCHALAADPKHG